MLATTLIGLVDFTEGLSPTQLLVPLEPNEWFTRYMLAYLHAGDDMWGKYIAQILNVDRPMVKAVNPTTWIKNMTHSQPQGFLAVPPAGIGPGVLVLHASWGLNDTIKAFCARLAESGFMTFAPDLYYGKVADSIADAEALGKAVDANHLQAKAEIVQATIFLTEKVGQADRSLAVIAFSLGGYYALHLADTDPEHIRSVVLFYGTDGTVGGDYRNSRADYLGHFAEDDPFESQSNVDNLEKTLRRAGCPVTFYVYSGTGHSFFEPDRSTYSQAAASLAWDRTLAFLKRSSS